MHSVKRSWDVNRALKTLHFVLLMLEVLTIQTVTGFVCDCAHASIAGNWNGWLKAGSKNIYLFPAIVTEQLSRTHILRTWQPDGEHCRWWENRQSETNQFPAAVRSGPRWLVMQLRQPIMLEEVNVRGWDGQWQAAAPVGSPVSALGASSLSLELQLEDPCRASWETFGSSDRWRPLGSAEAKSWTPTSAIRLLSQSSLSWQALNITGRRPLMQLNLSLSRHLFRHRYGLIFSEKFTQSNIYFFIDSCCRARPQCWLLRSDGNFIASHMGATEPNRDGARTHKFEIELFPGDHGKLLQCGFAGLGTVMLEELLLFEVPALALQLSVSPVLVVGHPAIVSVTSDSLPEAQHRCFTTRPGSQFRRNIIHSDASESKIVDPRNRTIVRVRSEFSFNVSLADLHGNISCTGKAVSDRTELLAHLNISSISEPCQTEVDLGPSTHWLVGEARQISVTSSRCSIWNVSHSCRLQLADGVPPEPLRRVQQGSFNSTHELQVVEAMTRSGWQVLCSVNQSGVELGDSKSNQSSNPAVFVRKPSSRVPVSNISCSTEAGDVTFLIKTINSAAWHGILPLRSNDFPVKVCCSSSQSYRGVTVFESKKCEYVNPKTGASNTIFYVMTAAAAQLLIILVVAMTTWRITLSRIRRPTARPVAARQGEFEGIPAVPLQQLTAATSETSPYEIPSSERGTVDDSAYERVRVPPPQPPTPWPHPSLPLPPVPSDSDEESRYMNWRP